jgi:lycopene cyclase domain-containing protein
VAGHFSYLVMLLFTFIGSGWLIFYYKVQIHKRVKALFLSIIPIAIIYLGWDALAIRDANWKFDQNLILDKYFLFHIPIEEVFFFLVVPLASILTIEAVIAQKAKKKF